MINKHVVAVMARNKWALAAVTLGAVVASSGAGAKWGFSFFG